MQASDDTPLSEFLIDTKIVRGAINGSNDESFLRRRIATLISVLGMFVIAHVAAASQLLLLLSAVPVVWIAAWLYAERPGFQFHRR